MVLCAIGRYLCFALEGGPPCFPRDFSCPAVLWCHLRVSLFRLPGFHCLWHCFPTVSAKVLRGSDGPQPRQSFLHRFGLLPCSLAATWEIDVSFSSSGYLDVSVPRVPSHALWIGAWVLEVCSSGFPHSDIRGSMDICSSPQLFAAYHVFHLSAKASTLRSL